MKQKDILILIIPACILIFAWIAFSVHHNFITSTIPENVSVQISSINASFDTNVIEDLKKRKKTQPVYRIVLLTPSPTPKPTLIPTPTQVQPTVSQTTQQSSGSGTLLTP